MKLGKCKIHSNKTLFICAFNCDFKKVCKFVENARSGTVKCGFTVVLMLSRIIVPLSPGSSTEIKMIKHLFSLDCLTLNIKTLQSFQKSGNTCPSHSQDLNLQHQSYVTPTGWFPVPPSVVWSTSLATV